MFDPDPKNGIDATWQQKSVYSSRPDKAGYSLIKGDRRRNFSPKEIEMNNARADGQTDGLLSLFFLLSSSYAWTAVATFSIDFFRQMDSDGLKLKKY